MSTCNLLDLQTLGSQLMVMPKNLPDHTSAPISCYCYWLSLKKRKRDLTKFKQIKRTLHTKISDLIVPGFYWIWCISIALCKPANMAMNFLFQVATIQVKPRHVIQNNVKLHKRFRWAWEYVKRDWNSPNNSYLLLWVWRFKLKVLSWVRSFTSTCAYGG